MLTNNNIDVSQPHNSHREEKIITKSEENRHDRLLVKWLSSHLKKKEMTVLPPKLINSKLSIILLTGKPYFHSPAPTKSEGAS